MIVVRLIPLWLAGWLGRWSLPLAYQIKKKVYAKAQIKTWPGDQKFSDIYFYHKQTNR